MHQDWINALAGGMLIGIAASLMLYWNGRVTGISGILNRSLFQTEGWRLSFLAGLFVGGLALARLRPEVFAGQLGNSGFSLGLAGILVGFGTALGGGCTSGHGVCGISRFSLRSIVATCVFIASGIAMVAILRNAGVYP